MTTEQATSEEDPALRVTDVRKVFRRESGEEVRAVDVDALDVARGEFVALLGPSGCGKTTLLRCIAGLESPDRGSILLAGRPVFSQPGGVDIPVESRNLSMVFQSYALWPHMTAEQNVAYPLRYSRTIGRGERLAKRELRERALTALGLVGVANIAGQYPAQMSGGQQQRVALARALVDRRSLILFDEPLSNVDARVREMLRTELALMHRELGFTAVYVTHDQVEAMDLASRIVVMENGRVAQVGSPRDVYQRPSSRYVADFIGSTNFVPVESIGDGLLRARFGTESLVVAVNEGNWRDFGPGDSTVLLVRPEDVHVSPSGSTSDGPSGMLLSGSLIGPLWEGILSVSGAQLRVRATENLDHLVGGEVRFRLEPKIAQLYPA